MNKGKIKLGLIGGGPNSFIGIVHRIAAYMGEQYQLVGGVFDIDHASGIAFAEKLELDTSRAYESLEVLIEKESALPAYERILVVFILTPNFPLHPMPMLLLVSGFKVLCA